jgi:Glycosyl hydrolase family 26
MSSGSSHRRAFRTSFPTVAALVSIIMIGSATAASARIMLGAHVQTPPRMTEIGAIKRFEHHIGHRLSAIRLYYQWDSDFPNPDAKWAKRTHHRIFISFKAKTETSSGYIPWQRVANARPGSGLYRDMVRWAQGMKRFKAPVLFSFQPEPEAWSGDPNGGPSDFRAAWRKMWHIFHARGVRNVTWVWTMTGWSFRDPEQRAISTWWPGAKYVDAAGADVYNWWKCRGGGDGWDALSSDIESVRRWGLRHPNMKLYLPEFGSVEDRSHPGRKARWFRDMEKTLKRPRYRQFKGLFYFHSRSTDDGRVCDWRVNTSRSSLRAFSSLTGDHFYRTR